MRVSKMTVYRLIHDGELPGSVRVRRSFRVPRPTVDQYLRDAAAIQAADSGVMRKGATCPHCSGPIGACWCPPAGTTT